MEENSVNTGYSEIDLKDMFLYCFMHWRSAIVICIIGALLIGAFQGFKTYKAAVENNIAYAEQQAELEAAREAEEDAEEEVQLSKEEQLKEDIKALNEQISDANKRIKEQTEYLAASPLMQINPDEEYRSICTVCVTIPGGLDRNTLTIIMNEYVQYILNGDYLEGVARSNGMSVPWLRELISASTSLSETPDYSGNSNTGVSGTFTISAKGLDSAQSSGILHGITAELPSIREKLMPLCDDQEMKILSEYTSAFRDSDLKTAQQKAKDEIASLNADVKDYQAQIKKLMDTPVEAEDEKVTEDGTVLLTETPVGSAAMKDFVKWAILGAIIAFILYGVILCIRYVLGGAKTRSAFFGRFPMKRLGAVRDGKKSLYKNNTSLDKWFRKCMGLEPERPTSEVAEMAASGLLLYCPDKKDFLLLGGSSIEEKEALAKSLSEKMPEKNFTVSGDILRDAGAKKNLKSADCVIFCETFGKIKNADLSDELTAVVDAELSIAGVITQ